MALCSLRRHKAHCYYYTHCFCIYFIYVFQSKFLIIYFFVSPTVNQVDQLGCDLYSTGDSGFSELTSLASSEDENQTNDVPLTRFVSLVTHLDISLYSPATHRFVFSFADMNTKPVSNPARCGQSTAEEAQSPESDVSDISGLSDLSNHDWEPTSGTMTWVQQQLMLGTDPRSVLTELVQDETQIPQHLDDVTRGRYFLYSDNRSNTS